MGKSRYKGRKNSRRMRVLRRRRIAVGGFALLFVLLLCWGGIRLARSGQSKRDTEKNTEESTEPKEIPGEEPDRTETESTGETSGEEPDKAETETTGEDAEASEMLSDHEYEKIISTDSVTSYNSIVTVGDSAYELFTYQKEIAESYAAAVNRLAEKLGNAAVVYDMLIPLSSEITFPDNLRDQINSTDQRTAMDRIFGMLEDSVVKLDIYDALMSHRTEYIYFRTDHHWTALGAYYAYERFCQEKGMEPETLDSYETKRFDGFLGSFYKDSGESAALGNHSDEIIAYLPKNYDSIRLSVTAADGTEFDWPIISDVSGYDASLKYSTFTAGDNPMTVVENSNLTDGSSCVVVKESFGNAFVPFLADHYQTIYVIDYRYWSGSVSGFAKEKGVKEVLLLNNLSMVRNKYLVGQLQGTV